MKIKLIIILLSIMGILKAQENITLFDKNNSKLPDNDLWSICKSEEDKIWIGSSKAGIITFSDSIFTKPEHQDAVGKSIITYIFRDSRGTVWFSLWKESKLLRYDGSGFIEVTNNALRNKDICFICEDTNGNVYFGGDNTLLKYDGTNWQDVSLPSGIIVRTIDVNANQEIAIGHNSGLLMYQNNKWKSYTTENSELQLGTVRAVKFTPDNKLMIGYGGGFGNGGLSLFDGQHWKHYNKTNSAILDHTVRDIEIDKKGYYWLATNNGLTKFKDEKVIKTILFNKGMYRNTVMDITIQDDNIWLATTTGLVKIAN